MTTACLYWEQPDSDNYQQHITRDERAITMAALAATETVTESSKSWPGFGEFDEDVCYVIKDRSVYESLKSVGEIDDYYAYFAGDDIQR